jgi:phosphoadenosine phosphosulfate reductase
VNPSVPQELINELAAADAALTHAAPLEVVEWAFERCGDKVAYACSFEDVALLHMIRQVAPGTEIIFLDTGGHFPETLDFVATLEREWQLQVTRTHPASDAAQWTCGTERCCELRKVEPLRRALAGRAGWITSLKRVDAPTRSALPVIHYDEKFGLIKVNPLAGWTDNDVAYYLAAHDLPQHPLWSRGYASIGCAPVTVAPLEPGDRRSGRWAGADKLECGLHEA